MEELKQQIEANIDGPTEEINMQEESSTDNKLDRDPR